MQNGMSQDIQDGISPESISVRIGIMKRRLQLIRMYTQGISGRTDV